MDRRTCQVSYMDEVLLFVRSLPAKARRKVAVNVSKIEDGLANREVFKKLEGTDIWEIRTKFDGMAYRLFAFWDTRHGALIIATHGLIKKTDKTPRKEIAKAERIRKEYFAAQS